jgi:hypothetical protein
MTTLDPSNSTQNLVCIPRDHDNATAYSVVLRDESTSDEYSITPNSVSVLQGVYTFPFTFIPKEGVSYYIRLYATINDEEVELYRTLRFATAQTDYDKYTMYNNWSVAPSENDNTFITI